MRVAVIGAAGMIGRRLVARLAGDGVIGTERVSRLLLVDVAPVEAVDAGEIEVQTIAADIAQPGAPHEILAGLPDVIFDLAAVVSGEAEAEFEKGYRVNVDANRLLLEAVRARYRLPAAGRVQLVDCSVRAAVS